MSRNANALSGLAGAGKFDELRSRLLFVLGALIVYGVGDMVGSGIYVTVGKAAGQMGNAVWLAFVVSMVAALPAIRWRFAATFAPRASGRLCCTAFGRRIGPPTRAPAISRTP